MEPEPATETQKSQPPPPLPAGLLALPPLVYTGILLWALASCVLLVLRYAFDLLPPIWLWTALSGTGLGFVGLAIMWWQRTASRRGTRGAQRDI